MIDSPDSAQSSFYQTGSPKYGFVDPEPVSEAAIVAAWRAVADAKCEHFVSIEWGVRVGQSKYYYASGHTREIRNWDDFADVFGEFPPHVKHFPYR